MLIVAAGKHKGSTGKASAVTEGRVTIEWVNVVKRATKKQGMVEKTLPIRISNVAHLDPKTKTASRVRIEEKAGKKVRVYVKSWQVIKKAA